MSHHFDTPTAREDSRINLLLASKSSGKLLPSTNVPFLCDRWAGMGLLKARVDAQSEAIREDSTSIRRVGLRFGNTSIIPLAQQPVNDPERYYRETQSGDSQRGCHLNIEDDEFSQAAPLQQLRGSGCSFRVHQLYSGCGRFANRAYW